MYASKISADEVQEHAAEVQKNEYNIMGFRKISALQVSLSVQTGFK